jgi:hypothetical protein
MIAPPISISRRTRSRPELLLAHLHRTLAAIALVINGNVERFQWRLLSSVHRVLPDRSERSRHPSEICALISDADGIGTFLSMVNLTACTGQTARGGALRTSRYEQESAGDACGTTWNVLEPTLRAVGLPSPSEHRPLSHPV